MEEERSREALRQLEGEGANREALAGQFSRSRGDLDALQARPVFPPPPLGQDYLYVPRYSFLSRARARESDFSEGVGCFLDPPLLRE